MKHLILILIFFSSAVYADHYNISEDLHINGYVGGRYVTSGISGFPIHSSPELGLNLSYDVTKNLSLYTQFYVDFDSGDLDNRWTSQHNWAYGFLTYRHPIKGNTSFKVDIGKIRHEFGLYNQNRINPRTRPGGILENQGIYRTIQRQVLTSGYGIKVTGETPDFSLSIAVSEPILTDPMAEAILWTGSPSLQLSPNFGDHKILNLNYHPQGEKWKIKTSYTHLHIRNGIDPQFITLGWEYNSGRWGFATEFLAFKPEGFSWTDLDNHDRGYTLSGYYDVSDRVTLYGNYNRRRATDDARRLIENAPFLPPDISRYRGFTLGLAWHKNDWEVKVEGGYNWGAYIVAPDKLDFSSQEYDDGYPYTGFSIIKYF